MKDPKTRREELLKTLYEKQKPMSGESLAEKFDVTRQVIVQDIAILRASGKDIVSTNRGYYLNEERTQKVFKVKHSDRDINKELNAIVDLGGRVKDVIVHHKVYGEIKKDLNCSSRRDVKIFIEKMKEEKSKPLDVLTGGVHYHTVLADNEEVIEEIEVVLKELGFLIEE
ncbi:transcription repressor NadR [uncultured Peptoniphilus sp.]|uniref:transcription repressor NadR n=1 Tax=uncultured Peptoniphilus sp. TaxID=254354 RepID=UPI001DBFD339|nr:transcription repressor NadR [uncultured Peptoniphilus sp.]MBS4882404.1 transcription repressor NadR [Peptoniphilus harei]MBS5945591.1 transcription repressor NadR [Peptoniphilus harei]MDU1583465.1 transcription repressor NadR [Peptoniphilus harei]MDU1663443.1 transcription repressor NadR [Peptoniphilus harei]MDU3010587.1 transcription repressor NadR [Peptoniphilus harei]